VTAFLSVSVPNAGIYKVARGIARLAATGILSMCSALHRIERQQPLLELPIRGTIRLAQLAGVDIDSYCWALEMPPWVP
jgi:hypothetical protein